MFDKIKQLKDLRDQAQRLKELLQSESVTGESNGVKIVMNGNQEVIACDIPSELLTYEKKAACEAAITEAMNSAVKNIQRVIARKMQESGGFPSLT